MTRRRRVLLVLALLAAALMWAWDWTWLRPLLQDHVRERSQRAVDFDRLRIQLDDTLSPRIVFNGLRVQNAPWAAVRRPLITAGEIAFTLTWRSLLFEDKLVVSRLRLVDARVDMERRADGLRNWRLTRPDDRGPGRIKVLTLDALRSTIHVTHAGIALDLDAAAMPLPEPQRLPDHADLALDTGIAFSGMLAGTPFDGRVMTSRVLSFVDSGVPFALRGTVRAEGVALQAEGRVVDLIALGEADVQARVSRGRSEAAGHVAIHHDPRTPQRPVVTATLASERVDLGDLMRGPEVAAAPHGEGTLARRLNAVDADVDWHIHRLDLPKVAPLHDARTRLKLAQGALEVERFELALARGSVAGRARLDTGGGGLPTMRLNANARGLPLAAFATRWPRAAQFGGELDAQLAWEARGEGVAAWLRSGSGTLAASVSHASIPAGLDARMALDGAGVVAALFKGGERVAVRCSVAQFEFKNGRGIARQLGLQTDRVAMTGRGHLDLGERRMELVLTPHLHRSALFALRKSVQVDGRFDSPQVTLVDRDDSAPDSACAPRG